MDITKVIKEAVYYARTHLGLKDEDEIYFTNILLGELGETNPYEGEIDEEHIEGLNVPDEIVEAFNKYLVEEKHMETNEASRFVTKLMGFLSPLPSQVQEEFENLCKRDSADALDYLYNLSIYNDYVQKTKVDRNLLWKANEEGSERYLEISINLSKPEKNTKDIKKLLTAKVGNKYPKCLLCKENLGFYGNDSHPARENIRTIELTLNGETWYLQYSPYGYYHKHCIVFNAKHDFMKIEKSSLIALFDFVTLFPSFFIGSNAELPIVGGSILNHEHFQGGEHLLPMIKAPLKEKIELKDYKDTEFYVIDWYNTSFLLKGKNRKEIEDIFERILAFYRTYDDESVGLLHESNGERHNTINPIVRKDGDTYYLYMILRNNRCDEENPEGIFHAHKEYYHIKKENIGLIEAMGLFILPARLVRQFGEIKTTILENISNEEAFKRYPGLEEFEPMINALRDKGSTIDESITNYVNNVCRHILDNTSVFKKDERGQEALHRFIKELNL